jgi:UDP-N-acetylmuramyl pentapeptide phosphotransferase/UDP-N-acetylglucosamine-1-phosphate transferase
LILTGFTIISVIFTAIAVRCQLHQHHRWPERSYSRHSNDYACCLRHHRKAGGRYSPAFTCLIIAGAVAGFLSTGQREDIFWGWRSLFSGFMLAWIAVFTRAQSLCFPWTSLLICSYPIIEVGFSFCEDLREGYHPTSQTSFTCTLWPTNAGQENSPIFQNLQMG